MKKSIRLYSGGFYIEPILWGIKNLSLVGNISQLHDKYKTDFNYYYIYKALFYNNLTNGCFLTINGKKMLKNSIIKIIKQQKNKLSN